MSSYWFNRIKEKPASFAYAKRRLELNTKGLDRALSSEYDEDKVITKLSQTYVKYGIYHVPGSVINLNQFREELDLPILPVYYASLQFGTAQDILDYLRISYFSIYETVIEQEHFFRMFRLKPDKIRKFLIEYDKAGFNCMKACDVLNIDFHSLYSKMARLTSEVTKDPRNQHSHIYGSQSDDS
tara:strand:- start:49822 stop:50373 length:552 start_codon:yes stop_codon:yes gene_type:complete